MDRERERARQVRSFIRDQVPIEPDRICHAWLEAHFSDPSPFNPLRHGMLPAFQSPYSPSASSTLSHAPYDPIIRVTPPKPPRQFPDPAMHVPNNYRFDTPMAQRPHGLVVFTGTQGQDATGPEGPVGGGHAPMCHNEMAEEGPSGGQSSSHLAATSSPPGTGATSNDDDDPNSFDSSIRTRFTDGLALDQPSIPMQPPRMKRKAKSVSPSKDSKASKPSSDTREKRLRLIDFEPPGRFGIPEVAPNDLEDSSTMPGVIIQLLAVTFSIGHLEKGCFPITPEIEQILKTHFPYESIAPAARYVVPSTPEATGHALELFKFVMDIHRACVQNSSKGQDEAAWNALVRGLLSVSAPDRSHPTNSMIPRPPASSFWSSRHDLFLTIDATTKATSMDIPPAVTVKLDALLAFNPSHPLCAKIADTKVRVNAFNDTIIHDAIVVLGVEVKSGVAGVMEAEYQVGVWGMKTLNLIRSHHGAPEPGKCEFALGISVCAHVWSMHLTYWRGRGIVTHGPVIIGGTDTLYGTMKIVAFVARFKEWARDVLLPDWIEMVAGQEV